jgi:hypothetical protein
MANTVSTLSYANTFGDWVVQTNSLASEINNLGSGSYIKSAGTLYLNAPTLGLQVSNNAIVAGQLAVQGTGSTAYVQNSLTVGGAITTGTITATSTSTGNISVTGSGTALTVTNAASFGTASIGTLTVSGGESIAGNLTVGGATIYSSNAGVWQISITGNAATSSNVANGVYTTGSYANPSWITSIANTKISGNIVSTQITSIANTQITGTIINSQIASGIVNSITGTANQITANTGSNNVLLSLPQSIATTSNVQFGSIGVGTTPDTANTGSIRAINNITAYYSDDRLKDKLGNIENALEKVQTLNGFYYQASQLAQDLGYKPTKEVGLSAQEVQAILPEVVVPAPIDEKYLTIHYERLIPLLVEAIKELKAEVDALKGN